MNLDMGIYSITSPSGGTYIGSTVSFKKRWGQHSSDLRRGKHHSKPLQNAFNKYGEGGLTYAKILLCPAEDLLVREQEQIDALRPEYNVSKFAGATTRGLKQSAEHIAKRVAARRENIANGSRTVSAETREKLSAASRGRKHSAEHVAKMAAAKLGKPQSAEHIEKRAEARRGKGLSDRARARMSSARNTSGYRGVAKDAWTGRWLAYAPVNGKRKHLGRFDTPELANDAVQSFLSDCK